MGIKPIGKPVSAVNPGKNKNGFLKDTSSEIQFRKGFAVSRVMRIIPVPLSSLIFFLLFGSGVFDSFFLSAKPVAFRTFPGDSEAEVRINKASVDIPLIPENPASALVFTRHRVSRGETLSRIAYKYGLTPSTLISVNSLENPEDIRKGVILIIPYIDGFRVSSRSGEGPGDVALRYGTVLDNVQVIPGSGDYFISGVPEEVHTPSSFTRDVFLYPVTGRILTAFGESVDTLTGIGYRSEGLDLYAAEGTPVKASRDGTVILTGNHSSYGLYVIMSHAGGWRSFYGHLKRVDVAPGEELRSGMTLGLAGSSGTARSPRLYFALIHEGESVDPLDYLF
jgi:murein DD-endopeptidase MepM/ murein hydrolase activator NlpD